jgi:hypothetical protein
MSRCSLESPYKRWKKKLVDTPQLFRRVGSKKRTAASQTAPESDTNIALYWHDDGVMN